MTTADNSILFIDNSSSFEIESKNNSRSPSVSSIDRWPPFFVSGISRREPLFMKCEYNIISFIWNIAIKLTCMLYYSLENKIRH
ncbi:hypothetical protein PGB90_002422 [Kerria lacca]